MSAPYSSDSLWPTVGSSVPDRGHGTQLINGELVSAVCGVVQRVNKLVSVAPLAGRYSAQLGDVVVGRVADIVPQRWKVDICARQDAVLQLSAVNLPGSAQVTGAPHKKPSRACAISRRFRLRPHAASSSQLSAAPGRWRRGGAR